MEEVHVQAKQGPTLRRVTVEQPQFTVTKQNTGGGGIVGWLKKHIPNGAFKTAGSAIGGIFGPAGAELGGGLGNTLSSIVGFGDYFIKSNSIMKGNPMPTFRQAGSGIRIAHREFVGDVLGTELFTNTPYEINPGNDSLFPWLAQVAHYFEQYTFAGLVMEYRPSSGMIGTSSPDLGMVMMATNYNVDDPPFASKQEMDAYEFATSCVAYQGMIHPVECKPGSNPLNHYYVRSVDTPDAKLFYDYGKFQIATKGQQDTYTVGELWVSYDVILTKPRLNVRGPNAMFSKGQSAAADCSAADPLEGVVLIHNTVPACSMYSSSQILFDEVGTFYGTIEWEGSSIGAVPQIGSGSYISFLQSPFLNYTTGKATASFYFSVTQQTSGAANLITIAGLTGMTGAAAYVTFIETPNPGSFLKQLVRKAITSKPKSTNTSEEEEYIPLPIKELDKGNWVRVEKKK